MAGVPQVLAGMSGEMEYGRLVRRRALRPFRFYAPASSPGECSISANLAVIGFLVMQQARQSSLPAVQRRSRLKAPHPLPLHASGEEGGPAQREG